MHIRILIFVLLIALAACATTASNASLLSNLASQLRELRALPEGAPTDAACPSDTSSLIGLSQDELQRALGPADFIDRSEWWYFFTSPTPPYQLGGGFPQLGFVFDPTKVVTKVVCYYAR